MNPEILLGFEVRVLREENLELRREIERLREQVGLLTAALQDEQRERPKRTAPSDPLSCFDDTSYSTPCGPPSIEASSSQQQVYILPQQPMMLIPGFPIPGYGIAQVTSQQHQHHPQVQLFHLPVASSPVLPSSTFDPAMPYGPGKPSGIHVNVNLNPYDYEAVSGPPSRSTPPTKRASLPVSEKRGCLPVSVRSAFVHQGKVYPPGLNRKEYRSIVCHLAEVQDFKRSFKAPEGISDGDIDIDVYEAMLEASKKEVLS
jgi:hypothetical protein